MAPRPEAPVDHASAKQEIPCTCPIERLNKEVQIKLKYHKTVRPLQALEASPKAVTAVERGAQVYHKRSHAAIAFYVALSVIAIIMSPSLAMTAAAFALSWLVVDFYGAVLHVVLDHSPFIDYPIIGDGCLEFQWHHAIPHDITSKPFSEVVGDLNYVALLHVVWHAVLFGGFTNYTANVVAASKLVMAYFGQYSHRMAHLPDVKRPGWVRMFQAVGIMVSPELHKDHHSTYNDGFPILSGFTAPLIAFLVRMMPNRHIWLGLFALMSLTDVYGMYWLLSKIVPTF